MKIVSDAEPERKVLEFRSGDHPRCKSKCRHQRFMIDRRHGSVECSDCGEPVSAFHALLAVAGEETTYWARLTAMRTEMREIAIYKPWLRAVKALEQIWRGKMLPVCPHCGRGVKAEAMAARGSVSPEYDAACHGDPA